MSENMNPSQPPTAGSPTANSSGQPCRLDINAILRDQREVVLMHNGEAYRLRITANNKLILTK